MINFAKGDSVRVKKNAIGPEHQVGRIYTVIGLEVNSDDKLLVVLDVKNSAEDCDVFFPSELELLQEDNVASWEDDYNDEYFDYWSLGDVGTYKVNQAFNETALQNEQKDMFAEDYLSDEYKVHWATKENEDWQERACQNITAVQQAYQAGLKHSGLEGLAAQCLKTATELHFADELHDNYDIVEFAAKMYKDFLKALEK